jgi:hypothetical protein
MIKIDRVAEQKHLKIATRYQISSIFHNHALNFEYMLNLRLQSARALNSEHFM